MWRLFALAPVGAHPHAGAGRSSLSSLVVCTGLWTLPAVQGCLRALAFVLLLVLRILARVRLAPRWWQPMLLSDCACCLTCCLIGAAVCALITMLPAAGLLLRLLLMPQQRHCCYFWGLLLLLTLLLCALPLLRAVRLQCHLSRGGKHRALASAGRPSCFRLLTLLVPCSCVFWVGCQACCTAGASVTLCTGPQTALRTLRRTLLNPNTHTHT